MIQILLDTQFTLLELSEIPGVTIKEVPGFFESTKMFMLYMDDQRIFINEQFDKDVDINTCDTPIDFMFSYDDVDKIMTAFIKKYKCPFSVTSDEDAEELNTFEPDVIYDEYPSIAEIEEIEIRDMEKYTHLKLTIKDGLVEIL